MPLRATRRVVWGLLPVPGTLVPWEGSHELSAEVEGEGSFPRVVEVLQEVVLSVAPPGSSLFKSPCQSYSYSHKGSVTVRSRISKFLPRGKSPFESSRFADILSVVGLPPFKGVCPVRRQSLIRLSSSTHLLSRRNGRLIED